MNFASTYLNKHPYGLIILYSNVFNPLLRRCPNSEFLIKFATKKHTFKWHSKSHIV